MIHRYIIAVLAVAAGVSVPLSAQAQSSVEEFYKGRDVKMVMGAGLGGSYGLYTQLVAKFLGKYIPGQPNLIVESMSGAGGLKGLNFNFSAAPKDGSVISVPHAEVLYWSLVNDDSRFNAKDFNWIGRMTSVESVIVAEKNSGLTSLDDAKAGDVATGATGLTSHTAVSPALVNKLVGTKFKIVSGYDGTAKIFLAMEQKELAAHAATWATLIGVQGEKFKSGELVPLIAMSSERLKPLPNVPCIGEFATDDTKAFLEIYASQGMIGRAISFPPGVPAEFVTALRKAFDQMLQDPDFLAEIKENNIEFDPMGGEELQSRINKISDLSSEQVEATKAMNKELLASVGS